METMVATVLIVVLFMMSSLLLNTIFASSVTGNNQQLTTHLQELEYQYKNGTLSIPYYEELNDWDIELDTESIGTSTFLSLQATHRETKQQIRNYSTLAE